MADQSHLDERYFVNTTVYNCPFCNRRHVAYSIYGAINFDWTEAKRCFAYFVRCHSCNNDSMHLSFVKIETYSVQVEAGVVRQRFSLPSGVDSGAALDEAFFYSVPTSFFVLDQRVPRTLRELLTEAEGSLKSNFLTGASACARKIVYELAVIEESEGDDYEARIKSLKEKHPEVEADYFDTLLTIQQVTSSKVHENAFDGWESKHLRIILASLKEILHELYVVPALRLDRRKAVLGLKSELLGHLAVEALDSPTKTA
jgi:hypothetical protein